MTRAGTGSGRRAEDAADRGFTLIELLVVMIIIGILAAIAIPVFLQQRKKAHDAAVKADVSNLGKEIATYWIGNTGPIVLDYSVPKRVSITDGTFTTYARLTVGSVPPATGAFSNLDSDVNWCVALTDPEGDRGVYRYSGLNGLEPGDCS